MNKTESRIITFVIGAAVPVLVFIFFWFFTAAVNVFNIAAVSVKLVIVVSFTGLGIGILLDILYLKKWTVNFYNANLKLMMFIYLYCSFVAIAFFMGVPVGNLILGILAGLYIGRKCRYTEESICNFSNSSRKVSIFTAVVIGAVSLPIGLLALTCGERYIAEDLLKIIGLNYSTINGLCLIGVLCIILMIMQFWFTKCAASRGYRYRKKHSIR